MVSILSVAQSLRMRPVTWAIMLLFYKRTLQDWMPWYPGSLCPPGFPSPVGAQPTFMKCPLAHILGPGWGWGPGAHWPFTLNEAAGQFLPLRHWTAILEQGNFELVLRFPRSLVCVESLPREQTSSSFSVLLKKCTASTTVRLEKDQQPQKIN